MEQMQNVMLNMLQTMTSVKTDSHQTTKKELSEESDFHKMMEEQRNPAQRKETVSEKTDQESVENKSVESEEELDQTAMQELAAMQMFYMDTAQNIVIPEEPVVSEVVEGTAAAETVLVEGEEQPSRMLNNGQEGVEQLEAEAAGDQHQLEEPIEAVDQNPDAQIDPEEKTAETQIADRPVENEDKSEDGQNEMSATGEEVQVFEHVEAAPIKVSEEAEPVQTAQTESVENQILEKMTQAAANGETKVELQLNPEHLGKVTIEITQKQDGTLHIAVHAENSQTRGLLERDAAGLQSLLGRNAQQEVHVEIYQPHENERNDVYDGHQHQHQQQQQEQKEQQRRRGEPVDFLNQLRLGLVSQNE